LHGLSDEKLMFFECPITKSYRPKLESTRLGLLSVTGGELTIPGIVKQLQRIVPVENFAWDCRQVGQNVFKVTFPDKDELERLTRFGTFLVPNCNIKLNFEQCVSSMEPTSNLPEVWILMAGIPKRRIGDFLAMWSLGTLFGKTIKVDMASTRASGVLRILVRCLDHTRIPAKERIYIADGFYDITFEVENPADFEMISEANPEDSPPDNEGNGNNDDQNNRDMKQGRDEMDTDTSPNLESAGDTSKSSAAGPDINKLANDFSSGVRFSPRVKLMMERARTELTAMAAAFSGDSLAGVELPSLATAPLSSIPAAAEVATMSMPSSANDATVSNFAAAARSSTPPASPGTDDVSAVGISPPPAVFPAAAESAPPASTWNAKAVVAAAAEWTAASPAVAESDTVFAQLPGNPVGAAVARSPPPAIFSATAEASGASANARNASANNFCVHQGSKGKFLPREEKTPSNIYAEEKTNRIPPSQGNYGCQSLETSATKTSPLKEQAQRTVAGSRVATAPFKPSSPTPPTRRPIKEVIAFGGIDQKLSSPVRSGERVKMQKNGDATQNGACSDDDRAAPLRHLSRY
jgi:hypothetical protein